MVPPIKKKAIDTTPPLRKTRAQTKLQEVDTLTVEAQNCDKKTNDIDPKSGAIKKQPTKLTNKPQPDNLKYNEGFGMLTRSRSLEKLAQDSLSDKNNIVTKTGASNKRTTKSTESTSQKDNPRKAETLKSEESMPDKPNIKPKANEPKKVLNNNNNINKIDEEKAHTELLVKLNKALTQPPEKEADPGYTRADLNQFLLNSTLKTKFKFILDIECELQIFKRLNSAIFAMKEVELEQLLDLYYLAIMMQSYEQLEPYLMSYRFELMHAVCELSVELLPEHLLYIGNGLCDRFVVGVGNKRLDKVICMHKGIVVLIKNSEVNLKIAMITLLATISKVSGLDVPVKQTDIILKAFEMVKLVDWHQLVMSDRVPDMFVLVRSFSLIMNTKENRSAHDDWDRKLGREIHHFFMTVLRTVRCSRHYSLFEMMIERYIAFCVVVAATDRPYTPVNFQ